ncbi:hypothetical protein BC332_23519 [Capsicum chinense]|nr:hypothetical protein BC332_23519 [Capsicum chinense]
MRVVGGRLTKVIYANLIMILEDAYLCREYGWGELSFDETISSLKNSLKPTKTTVGSLYQLVGFPDAFMKGVVEAFLLEHELVSNNDSEDKQFCLLNQKLDKLQSTCSKKFKKILNENKSLKSELSEIKTLLLGKLKADKDILFNKQLDNLQGKPSCDPMVDDQYDDPHRPTEKRSLLVLLVLLVLNKDQDPGVSLVVVQKKKQQAEEGKNAEGHSDKKEEAAEGRVTGLGPLNMEEMRQAKNQKKNAGAEDLLPFPLIEEFSKCSFYFELQNFGGTKVDEDKIDETKNCGDVDSIINNVISSVFAASSSLSTSPDAKNTQAERSQELSGIKNDTTGMIFDVMQLQRKIFLPSPRNMRLRSISEASIMMQTYRGTSDCDAFVYAFAEYVIHGRDIPKEIDIGYVHMRTFVFGVFVIRSFILSGTIHDVVLPTGMTVSDSPESDGTTQVPCCN